MTVERHDGGCLCGGIRYRIDGPIPSVAHCHCRMCQKASGAVVMTWALIRPETFDLTHGELRTWWSSAKGERTFCPGCGAQITFRHTSAPEELGVTLASLDDAGAHAATHHIYTESRLPWLNLDGHLRAYRREPGGDPDGI
jgi:hypothetical protein